ncbi:hypothetical protein FXF51_01630 [Nonomuraea sp. PA05]|uniref:DUF6197 family protein n=1 Tax=Nonomuraea sp. PA05 TaxID=2604466 RepID=UPI0011D716DC|nr:hypothetical protein [Nonomuraea sp. PA05]TYB71162.1 hypothetical protein FXF51_01630 [Nonomuraea sp. PA05]
MIDVSQRAVLERAAGVIEHNGLVRHFYYDREQTFPGVAFDSEADHKAARRLCPLGAIAVACDLEPDAWAEGNRDRNDARFQAAEDAAWHLVQYLEHHGLVTPGDSSPEAIISGVGEWADAGGHVGIARPLEVIVATMRTAARWEPAA